LCFNPGEEDYDRYGTAVLDFMGKLQPTWRSTAACSRTSNPGSTRTGLKTFGTFTARPIHRRSSPGALPRSRTVSCLSATCTAGCWAPRRDCCRGAGRTR
jgi:hypothetical protein